MIQKGRYVLFYPSDKAAVALQGHIQFVRTILRNQREAEQVSAEAVEFRVEEIAHGTVFPGVIPLVHPRWTVRANIALLPSTLGENR